MDMQLLGKEDVHCGDCQRALLRLCHAILTGATATDVVPHATGPPHRMQGFSDVCAFCSQQCLETLRVDYKCVNLCTPPPPADMAAGLMPVSSGSSGTPAPHEASSGAHTQLEGAPHATEAP